MLYSKIVNILFCLLKNAYRFKKHFFHTKYIFLCIIALKNLIYKDLLTATQSSLELFFYQAL